MALNYLFKAFFEDGSVILQTQEDVSVTKPGGNAFTDVMARQDSGITLEVFMLEDEFQNMYSVNLRDGHFEVNGIPFVMHDFPASNIRLIFFHRVYQHINVNMENGDIKQIKEIREYHFGWQGNRPDGTNEKRVMTII